jgi:radical SAM superfamily enzyme YgiQ (UPF0313 family)
MTRLALVSFGNEESYGLLYAGTELKKYGEIKYFDAEFDSVVGSISSYEPDYICFSPMTCFYQQAKKIENEVKEKLPNVVSIYGGHHASNSGKDCGDITVIGSVHGLDLSRRGIVFGGATKPENLIWPAREEYYRDIPRMRTRYRKVMLSVVGCPWSCSYCSSALENTKRMYGETKSALRHRDIEDVIQEAKFLKPHTHEIEWVDDDILMGDYEWYYTFFKRWQEEIGLPMYVSTTSVNVLKAPDALLDLMRRSVNCVGMGVQAIRPSSLRLLGRAWDSEKQIKEAYDRLVEHGFRVNLQAIVGLPVGDPVEDALDTVDGLVRMGKGCIASVYPLQIYPNTRMEKYCLENKFFLNDCEGDTNTGESAINFGTKVNNRIKNICKLATMVVKYGIERKWLEALLDIELDESSEALSLARYFECIKDRLPEKAENLYESITRTMHLRH